MLSITCNLRFLIADDSLATVELAAEFEPKVLKPYTKNETVMTITMKSLDPTRTFWCECDINVKPPLTLAHDKELNIGRTRIGILKPSGTLAKPIRLYTSVNNFPDEYPVSIIAYVYDEDGAIAERLEFGKGIKCEG